MHLPNPRQVLGRWQISKKVRFRVHPPAKSHRPCSDRKRTADTLKRTVEDMSENEEVPFVNERGVVENMEDEGGEE